MNPQLCLLPLLLLRLRLRLRLRIRLRLGISVWCFVWRKKILEQIVAVFRRPTLIGVANRGCFQAPARMPGLIT